MVEGRSAQAVTEFLAATPAHRAKAEAITEVVMDMGPAYIAGVQAHFPNARIVFFHIMKLAGEALDAVRKSLRQQGADLTRGLWAMRSNEWTRSPATARPAPQLGPRLGGEAIGTVARTSACWVRRMTGKRGPV